MQYGTVTGRFLAPDGKPLQGSVRFTPEVSAVLVSGVDPVTVLPADVVATLDVEGRMTATLLVPDATTNPVDWTWRIITSLTSGGKYLASQSWSINVTPAGGNLTELAPVPAATGRAILRGPSNYDLWLAEGNTGTVADYLATQTAGGIDLTGYVTDIELADGLAPKANRTEIPDVTGYATTTYVDNAVASVPAGESVDLTGYATTTYVDQAETDAVNAANGYTDTKVANIPAPDLSPYALKTEIPAPTDLTGYATEVYVGEQIAANQPDLAPYVTDTELTTALAPYALDTDLAGYATTAYADQSEADAVTTANTYTDQQIAAIPAPDLTGYVTDAELTTTLSGYTTDTELSTALSGKSNTGHGHATSDITGLDAALSGKANTTDVVLTVNGAAPDDAGNVTVENGTGGTTDTATAHTWTAVQTFSAGSGAPAIDTTHINVRPRAWNGSASMFLDNEQGQQWEFFANFKGEFGVWDVTGFKQPFTITPEAGDASLSLGTSLNVGVPINAGSGIMATSRPVPATATSPGVLGEIAYTNDHIYVCVAANTWRRSPLTAW